ncbi:hypothetical protein ABH926_009045 [Catenulispora sp. GP43]|uniref:hypothetical protein n=1 Tax=Catenulispora sp. GP43 TaxID=3156263 RepID=UPI0035124D60
MVLLASACAAQHSAAPSSTSTPPNCAAPSGRPASDGSAAARYLAIANAGNQRLETDFDHLNGPDQGNLSAAQADLRDAAATEHLFDRCLRAIEFPPPTQTAAKSLFAVNEARADLTATAAHATSVARLAEYEKQLTAANVPVERAVTTIRQQLGLPPPPTS